MHRLELCLKFEYFFLFYIERTNSLNVTTTTKNFVSAPPAFRSKIYIYYVCFYILQNVPINIVILIITKSLHFLVFNLRCYKLAWHVVDKKTRQSSISSSFGRLKCVNKALNDEKIFHFFFLCCYDLIRIKNRGALESFLVRNINYEIS